MKRVFLGGATALPLAARAQQPVMPVIGFLGAGLASSTPQVAAFRQALAEAGYVEGRNVTIEYRWAEGQYDRLPAMATELVQRQVAAIVTSPCSNRGKGCNRDYSDCVQRGWGSGQARSRRQSRPAGNATGVNSFLAELGAKQLGLLHELLPKAARIGRWSIRPTRILKT
jgi:putative ABC transport system substrate-binding protein